MSRACPLRDEVEVEGACEQGFHISTKTYTQQRDGQESTTANMSDISQARMYSVAVELLKMVENTAETRAIAEHLILILKSHGSSSRSTPPQEYRKNLPIYEQYGKEYKPCDRLLKLAMDRADEPDVDWAVPGFPVKPGMQWEKAVNPKMYGPKAGIRSPAKTGGVDPAICRLCTIAFLQRFAAGGAAAGGATAAPGAAAASAGAAAALGSS